MYTLEIQTYLRKLAAKMSAATGGAVDEDELFSVAECSAAQHLQKWDETRAGGNLGAYLCQRARWAIQDYLREIDPLSRRQRSNGVKSAPAIRLDLQPAGFLDLFVSSPADRGEEDSAGADLVIALAKLPERTQRILRLYYWKDKTLDEIAAVTGVTKQRVHQIILKTLETLRLRLANKTAGSVK